MLKIGDIELKNSVELAPMAGVCCPAFRLIAKEFGTDLVCALAGMMSIGMRLRMLAR